MTQKTRKITIRLTPQQHKQIKKDAKKHNYQNTSDYIRTQLLTQKTIQNKIQKIHQQLQKIQNQ